MMQLVDTKGPAWHELPADAVLSRLRTRLSGLSDEEAAERLASYGPNELQAAGRASPWAILLEQFQNVLIVILLVAVALSAFLGHGMEAVAIGVIVLFAALLGFLQEYRAERAVHALRQMAAPLATVLRNGRETSIPARQLVPGDVILLTAGNRVPADGRILEAVNLQAEEAALTGESVAVEKQTSPIGDAQAALGDRTNLVYAGTAVAYGRGRAVVIATGMETEFGKIASMLQGVETGKTPLQINLDKVGRSLAKAGLVVVVLVIALGIWRGQPPIEMLIFGIALGVAVAPEALPAVVTISLAIGVQRMVKRNALMRRLPAVETLGSTSVICSDKTGTLTKDEMTVRRIAVAGAVLDVSGAGYEPVGHFELDGDRVETSPSLVRLLTAATLVSDSHVERAGQDGPWQVKGDPTEGAIIVAAAKAGLDKEQLDAEHPRIHEIPFASETKRMTTIHAGPAGSLVCSKGAPEVILASCTRQVTPDGDVLLDEASRARYLGLAQQFAGQALRVLAVADKPGAELSDGKEGMTFLGLVGMIDPPRPEAKAAIETCDSAGIKVAMITGDHPVTAQEVARELGVLKRGRVVTGAELEAMSDADLERAVAEIDVYARVSPAHKLRVVTAFQKNGHIVAMTGDGVNDAPALKKADIGIAMGITGTDVSREAAAMTLIDDNFASIVAAVEEGRLIFDNIKKYLMYLLSSNIGEILLMVGASLAGLPLPLTAVQILCINLATDGLPALALAVDPPEPGLMRRRPRSRDSGIFTRSVVTLMMIGGVWSAIVNLGLFAWELQSGRSLEHAMTMTFVSLVLIQFFKSYNFRSDRVSVLRQPFKNRWLNRAIIGEVLLLGLIVYVPMLQKPFATYGLSLTDWCIVVAAAFTICPILEMAKWCERRGLIGASDCVLR
ncbi:MAG: ATPase [Planctomycetota bacterium]|nr:MAG: ATPase [Planctomycetota bacterium]